MDGTTLTCTKSHKVGVPTKWCGVSLENTTTCHKPCPNGTDAECDNGELCWGDSPCALIEKDTSKLWCARSYKHLVEHCPKPCPGGTDTECGLDEDNVTPMKCFNMEGNATDVCKEEGAGSRQVQTQGKYGGKFHPMLMARTRDNEARLLGSIIPSYGKSWRMTRGGRCRQGKRIYCRTFIVTWKEFTWSCSGADIY